MNTPQIAASALDGYKNAKLSDERINFLIAQANEQLDEISGNKELYDEFLEEVNAPKKVDNIILWILFMSNEDICRDYINAFDKDLMKVVPRSDLADLLLYSVYLKKVKNTELDGYDYLVEYDGEGMEDVDQYTLTNAFSIFNKQKKYK